MLKWLAVNVHLSTGHPLAGGREKRMRRAYLSGVGRPLSEWNAAPHVQSTQEIVAVVITMDDNVSLISIFNISNGSTLFRETGCPASIHESSERLI